MNTPLFEQLTESEKKLFLELSRVDDQTVWGLAISNVVMNPTVERFRSLVTQLKSQANDCADTMQSILGEPCYFKLLNL